MLRARYARLEDALPHLEIGDVVLIKGKQRFVSKIISKFTRSYWTHVAMVFDLPHSDPQTSDVLLVEALDSRGIEIHRMAYYLRQRDQYAIGIKRFPGLTDEERERMRGFFLSAVDKPYDMSRIFAMFISPFMLHWTGLPYVRTVTKKLLKVNQYICTSLVQRALYLAAAPEKRESTFFRRDKDLEFLEKWRSSHRAI